VLRQTIELVEVLVRDSKMLIQTKDFLAQSVRNLSREGFGIASTFGIDYQHQAICLDTAPARFREAINARFKQAGMKDDIEDMLVEFKEAGTSSLDYQIYIILNGRAANAYFRAQRMVQQACVDTCNREGWVIPFTQVTLHSGDTAEGPGKRPVESASSITQIAAAPQQDPD
jgi:small-conductance mechanosensitive channel